MTRRFGQYEILGRLALGGMATLDRVRTHSGAYAGQNLVLKRLLPERVTDAGWRRMFRHEIEVTSTLVHENCVTFCEGGELDGVLYLLMEEVHGPHLGQWIGAALRGRRSVPVILCAGLLRQVALGLAHIHRCADAPASGGRSIIHRDVCPQNILIDERGCAQLIDFGISHSQNAPPELADNIVRGRPGYMSPEQCRGERVDPRSDVFSWGIVAYELFTQRRLFQAATQEEQLAINERAQIAPVRTRNAALPMELAQIVDLALMRRPAERACQMDQIADRLLAWLQSQAGYSSSVPFQQWMSGQWTAWHDQNQKDMLSSAQSGEP